MAKPQGFAGDTQSGHCWRPTLAVSLAHSCEASYSSSSMM